MNPVALAAAISLLPALLLAQPAEPDGYRMDAYRAPVPATLAGGTVIGPGEAHALWQDGAAIFVDVMPQAPKPPNLPEGTIWRDKPRDTIPGAIWLPNVGYGAIAPETEAYFRHNLDEATGGDPDRAVVIFCLAECWMSWNAAKRIIEWGHADVYWLPEGTDGWSGLGHPTEPVRPEPPQPGIR